MNVITKTVSLPDGREISIETGKLAKQADGSVMLRMGNTMLLATVCAAKDAVPGTDFMPLQVEYREKYAAAGRFPGGFTKREGKASDEEILTCRLVDRALRPLFPSNYHAEVYVNVILFSADGVDMPDALAGFAASAALAASDIPFEGPISEVRVARINGEFVINPTFEQLKSADMDLMVGATEENIMMVEGEMKEVSEQDLLEALKAAHEAIKPQCRIQKELMKELGTDVKREYCHEVNDDELKADISAKCYQPAYDVTKQGLEKHARAEAFEKIREDYKEAYAAAHTDLSEDELEEKYTLIDRYYHDVERDATETNNKKRFLKNLDFMANIIEAAKEEEIEKNKNKKSRNIKTEKEKDQSPIIKVSKSLDTSEIKKRFNYHLHPKPDKPIDYLKEIMKGKKGNQKKEKKDQGVGEMLAELNDDNKINGRNQIIDTFDMIKSKTNAIDQKVTEKKEYMKVKGGYINNTNIGDEVGNLLIESIQNKLSLLNKLKGQ